MINKLSNKYQDLDRQNYLQTFSRFPVTISHGKGSRVWDVDGNEYIDVMGGIAVNSVGHCHPDVVKAIREQSARLMHISNFFLSEPQVRLSEKLKAITGLERVFLTNSGAESVEGAMKIARKYAHGKGKGGNIISFENCFHGRTIATIAAGKRQMQEGFEPMPGGFIQVPFNDMDAVKKAASDDDTAAIIIEPIQGEGGVNEVEQGFLHDLSDFCKERDIVLIFDEIQCGMGRTGKMFAKDLYGVMPDILTLAKALGGGFPVGAILSNEKVSSAINFGDHGTTFGGNPLACAASLATIRVIESEGLLKQAEEKGAWLGSRLMAMNNPHLKEIRGRGLMIGAVFDMEVKGLVADLLENGVLANATSGNVLRLLPALNISYSDLEEAIGVIEKSLNKI